MKTLKRIGLAGALMMVTLVVVLIIGKRLNPSPPASAETAPAVSASPEVKGISAGPMPERGQAPRRVVPPPTAPEPVTVVPETGGPASMMVRVKPEQRLATINGVAITLKELVPSRHVTAAHVQDYYQRHQAEYASLPADPGLRQEAWRKIDQDIRLKLAPQLQSQHQEQFQKFLEQLKAAAQIATAPPGS